MEREKVQLNVRIDKELYLKLKKYCNKYPYPNYKYNNIVTLALEEYFEKEK